LFEPAKAHIRQAVLSSEEAIKIVTESRDMDELRILLQKLRDRLNYWSCCIVLTIWYK